MTDSELVRIDKKAMMEPLQREYEPSDMSTALFAGTEHPI